MTPSSADVNSSDGAQIARQLATKLGFAQGLAQVRCSEGEWLVREEQPGIGTRLLVLLGSSAEGDVLLDLEPGLCKVSYVDCTGLRIGAGEWLVFGGETPVPRTCRERASVAALVVENVRL